MQSMQLSIELVLVPSWFVYTAAPCTALHYVTTKYCEYAVSDARIELTAMQCKDRIQYYSCVR